MSEKDIHGNNYNAHPETARNKWFNYSDAYIDKDGKTSPWQTTRNSLRSP